jgi:hypothetical protein
MRVGNRRHIPREQKQLLVIMANHKTPQEIAATTNLSERTVQRVLRKWRTTGDVVRIPLELGRHSIVVVAGIVRRASILYVDRPTADARRVVIKVILWRRTGGWIKLVIWCANLRFIWLGCARPELCSKIENVYRF